MMGVDLFGDKTIAGAPARKSAMLGKANYERDPADAYFTPPWCVDVLLDAWPIRGPVVEPACGLGHIVCALRRRGHHVVAADLFDYGPNQQFDGGWVQRDFLRDPILATAAGAPVNAIVTNPPYKHSDAFVRQAIERVVFDAAREGQAAFLLNTLWDAAMTRDDIFSEQAHFAAKIVLTRRVRWLGRDGMPIGSASGAKAAPRQNHAWFIWDAAHAGPAHLLRGRT